MRADYGAQVRSPTLGRSAQRVLPLGTPYVTWRQYVSAGVRERRRATHDSRTQRGWASGVGDRAGRSGRGAAHAGNAKAPEITAAELTRIKLLAPQTQGRPGWRRRQRRVHRAAAQRQQVRRQVRGSRGQDQSLGRGLVCKPAAGSLVNLRNGREPAGGCFCGDLAPAGQPNRSRTGTRSARTRSRWCARGR